MGVISISGRHVSMSIAKIIILSVVLVVVVGVALVALAAFSIFKGVSGDAAPLSATAIAEGKAVEQKIDAALSETSAFYLELTDEELSALLLYRAGLESPIRDISAKIKPNTVEIAGSLGNTPAVPFSGAVAVNFEDGLISMDVQDISLSFLPVPGAVQEELQPLIDQGLDINEALNKSGATSIQSFDMQVGRVTIVGVQKNGASVSAVTTKALLDAAQASGQQPSPVPPGSDLVPPGSAGTKEAGADVYLALGDSLAASVGANSPQEGYVSRFHAYLERETGKDLGLTNLGISGESSMSFNQGQFQQGLELIGSLKADGDPSTTISVVTLDLGANDLLTHLGSAECQLEPQGGACQARINAGLDGFAQAFPQIVNTFRDEMEDESELYIMTMYNPFDLGLGIPFETFSNEIIGRLNVIIADNAAQVGAKLADPFDSMASNASAWTNMLQGDIHPNADGYQALAHSLVEAK